MFGGVHDRCHERALEQLGCCPFHGGECEGPLLDSVRKACADELASPYVGDAPDTEGSSDETGESDSGPA